MKVDLLIPCFNEDLNIKTLINSWYKIVLNNENLNIYFINNGSTDNTKETIVNELNKYQSECLYFIDIPVNQGYGHGLKEGIKQTNSKFIAWTHADLQIPSDNVAMIINDFLKKDKKESLIFKGKRNGRGQFDKFFTYMMSFLGYILTGIFVNDINAQPKVFSRELVIEIENYPDDFSIDTHLLFTGKKKNYIIEEKDSLFLDREFNEAKGGGSLMGKLKLSYNTLVYFYNFKNS